MMDHKERIKRMVVEAGGVPMRENCLEAGAFPWGVEMEIDALERLIQAVARECIALCNDERTEFAGQAAKNDGRRSDMAFGSVSSAERITVAIRARFGMGE